MAKKKEKTLFNEKDKISIIAQKLAENELQDIDLSMFDCENFSATKSLYDYQSESLKNALRMLIKFYGDFKGDKDKLYAFYRSNYSFCNCDFLKPHALLKEHYHVTQKGCVEFRHLINRLSFWLTTGSGKSVVIIKLVELLDMAMNLNLIPKKTLLFFTSSIELLEQFKKEVTSYNENKDKKIECIDLKNYTKESGLFLQQEIRLFVCRADLMNDESKVEILDYKDYFDSGENYVILDEAHKGIKEESKRQAIFSILSQKGFLFNFSATFIESSDIVTTIYNLNQTEWVKKGYGKKLFLLDNNLKAFKEKEELNNKEKEQAVIKSLLLLVLAQNSRLKNLYHNPMMLVFTHSVNVKESDAEMFFKTLARIIKDDDTALFNNAKRELKSELEATHYLVSDTENEVFELASLLDSVSYESFKQSVFYESRGNIEAIINPNNKQEIAFKLDTSHKVFCLIKIGDIKAWLKEKLQGIKIDESYKESSYFEDLDNSSVNILVGSRAFNTGWDSTRPNIILFLNIGTQDEAQKFVMQSIGRGMRIESVESKRQRLDYIHLDNKSDFSKNAKVLETLFIVATSKKSVETIIKAQKIEKACNDFDEIALEKTPFKKKYALYIPTYKHSKTSIDKLDKSCSFYMSKKDLEELKEYLKNLAPEIFALKHGVFNKKDCDLFYKVIQDNHVNLKGENLWEYNDLNLLIKHLIPKLKIMQSEIKDFKILEEEIVHFKKIKIRADKKEKLVEKLQEIKEYTPLSDEEITLNDIDKHKQHKKFKLDGIELQKLTEHYYTPIITSKEKLEWIKHIIDVESERDFLEELVGISQTISDKYAFWAFSKIDPCDEEIYIPYIRDGKEHKFYPDFIFWLQKNDTQIIVFIDPKGSGRSEYGFKVDDYKKIFKDKNRQEVKTFNPKNNKNLKIKVFLKLYQNNHNDIIEGYKKDWIKKGSLKEFFEKIYEN
ncbi:DEAD/DEAH box helicase family protein [Helicobacter cetorum]|uniref:DEAD/DEAH box helicase family protein n=1 Tax=Helicobacter cetorum TaxID=138563 RepID=UPI000CF11329|nr:DEAD/DEAH box helicase family protein [Helicobacter cetorum]